MSLAGDRQELAGWHRPGSTSAKCPMIGAAFVHHQVQPSPEQPFPYLWAGGWLRIKTTSISPSAEPLARWVWGQRAPIMGNWELPRGTALPPAPQHSPRPR